MKKSKKPIIIGIYKIINLLNGKVYIGQSINIYQRWLSHKSHLRAGTHHGDHLQNSWNKYGEKKFKFEILIQCTIELLDKLEDFYITKYNSTDYNFGYNTELPGKRFSEKTKKKMSLAKKGNPKYKDNLIKARHTRLANRLPILQFSLEGNLIKKWDNREELVKALNIPDLSQVLKCTRSITNHAYGYRWKLFSKENPLLELPSYKIPKRKNLVYVKYKNNSEEFLFKSLVEASKYFNVDYTTIGKWLNGKLRFTREGELTYG